MGAAKIQFEAPDDPTPLPITPTVGAKKRSVRINAFAEKIASRYPLLHFVEVFPFQTVPAMNADVETAPLAGTDHRGGSPDHGHVSRDGRSFNCKQRCDC